MTAQLDLLDAISRKDDGIAQVIVNSDVQDRQVVEQAIREVAGRGRPFSSHDVRPLLPVLRSENLIGAQFNALARKKVIRKIGYRQCETPSSHGRVVAVWELVR